MARRGPAHRAEQTFFVLYLTRVCVKTLPQVESSQNRLKLNKDKTLVITENGAETSFIAADNKAVVLAGDYLNKLSGEAIERECKNKLESGVKELVVDFSQTEIINSIGISILLGVIDTAASSGAKVVFSDLNEESAELFEMLGLTKHVTIA